MSNELNASKDRVAFVTAATTGYARDAGEVTAASMALDACIRALNDVGLRARDVDGLVGDNPAYIQAALGIPELTYWSNTKHSVSTLVDTINAVYTGACRVALVYHSNYRTPANSQSAAKYPFRRIDGSGYRPPLDGMGPDTLHGPAAYAAWANRYLYEYNETRDLFAYIALNARSNAVNNSGAVLRDPISIEDYMSARMIRWPLCLLDMDVPVDGADAFIVTTTEHARDLPHKPVLVHACAQGMINQNAEDQSPGLRNHSQHAVVRSLRARSDIWLDDFDIYFPYDGFSFIPIAWFEALGWCGPGDARGFFEDNWDHNESRLSLGGRVPVNTHGGALTEGGNQAAGHVREAVLQLQGRVGERQVSEARKALITSFGLFWNPRALVLRTE
jgi:acetyl-CoA acetyltransferase